MASKTRKSKSKKAVQFEELSWNAASQFSATKGKRFSPERALQLGYVDLGDDYPRPKANKSYNVIVASSEKIGNVKYPSSEFKRLNLDLYEFFVDDMPDFLSRNNEGMIKLGVSTKNPQDLSGSDFDAGFAADFQGRDGSYATSFLYRGVFRNVIIEEWANFKIELYELDTDAVEYYDKITGVIDKVPEVKNLDVLKGIPYLNLATQLFDGIIRTFGRNPDDHLWGELPILEFNPTPGGAFLRTGIYILMEKQNKKKEEMKFNKLTYRNGKLIHKDGKRLSNHLIFGISIKAHK